MYKSYYFLNRYILELRQNLIGKIILEIFSQEKDKLIIHVRSEKKDSYIEFNSSQNHPYILLRTRFNRAKKNTIDFFELLIGSNIVDVVIASDDRIIKILTSTGQLVFMIRGNLTNVFAIQDDQIFNFKKEENLKLDKLKSEILDKKYLSTFNMIDEKILLGKTIEQIKKDFPFLGKDILNEFKLRENQNSSIHETIREILFIIRDNKPSVFYDDNFNIIRIGFDKLKIFAELNKESYEDLSTALNAYFSKKYFISDYAAKKNRIELFLKKELKKVTDKLNNLDTVIKKGSNEKLYNKFANLLLVNLEKIYSGADNIEVEDIYDENKKIIIKLDPRLNAKKNVNRYFEKSRDEKINFEKSNRLRHDARKYFEKLKLLEHKTENAKSINELESIMKELNLQENTFAKEEKDSLKFKHYVIADKYHVYVGKDSSNNDLLTTKFAKQNDYWFHARSVSGSHVVLRVENSKEVIPKNVLMKAASLAAYHSKAKTAGTVPVSYTLKKYVVKRKSMPAGQVSLLNEKVLLVEPEIPKDCEFVP